MLWQCQAKQRHIVRADCPLQSAGRSTVWHFPFITHHYVKLLLYPTSTERLDLLPVIVSQEQQNCLPYWIQHTYSSTHCWAVVKDRTCFWKASTDRKATGFDWLSCLCKISQFPGLEVGQDVEQHFSVSQRVHQIFP